MGLKKTFKKLINKLASRRYRGKAIDMELERIRSLKRFTVGTAHVFNKPFKFHDGGSFVATYNELFKDQIYQFEASSDSSVIIDCGANMGLSVLYFALDHPKHKIIAFEPEEAIFNILEENVQTFELKNVTLYKKAVWTKAETLKFYSDGGMGGRVNQEYKNKQPVLIDALPLTDFLNQEIDFLKLDIEGAEDEVLRQCAPKLHRAKHIFFEYHNRINKPQTLHQLLSIVKDQGFLYYLKESAPRNRPFVDEKVICETFDMALNVFCYKRDPKAKN